MNPFYFGSSAAPIFGVLHPPHCSSAAGGVVLCPAVWDEYGPSHRPFRLLAQRLARAGFPVLRFDYRGSGDSFGDEHAASVAQWREDIVMAVQELKDLGQVEQVSLVGLRFGATLAALVAATDVRVRDLVLWDPVVRGADWLSELRHRHADLVMNVLRLAPTSVQEDGLVGFPCAPRLDNEVSAIDLGAVSDLSAERVLLLTSEERPGYRDLRRHLGRLGSQVQSQHVAVQPIWEERALWSNTLVPVEVVGHIVEWLTSP